MPAHQRLGLEDNGFAHGREQPIEPDEDQAIDPRCDLATAIERLDLPRLRPFKAAAAAKARFARFGQLFAIWPIYRHHKVSLLDRVTQGTVASRRKLSLSRSPRRCSGPPFVGVSERRQLRITELPGNLLERHPVICQITSGKALADPVEDFAKARPFLGQVSRE